MKLKELGLILAVTATVGTCYAWDIKSDYDWAPAFESRVRESGWSRIASQNNYSDPIRPWTLLKAPTTGIWFVNPARKITFDDFRTGVPVLFAHWDYSKTESFQFVVAYDNATGKIADIYGDSIATSLNGVPDTLWKVPHTDVDSAVYRFLSGGLK